MQAIWRRLLCELRKQSRRWPWILQTDAGLLQQARLCRQTSHSFKLTFERAWYDFYLTTCNIFRQYQFIVYFYNNLNVFRYSNERRLTMETHEEIPSWEISSPWCKTKPEPAIRKIHPCKIFKILYPAIMSVILILQVYICLYIGQISNSVVWRDRAYRITLHKFISAI